MFQKLCHLYFSHSAALRPTCKVNEKGQTLTHDDIKKIPEMFRIWTWRPWLCLQDFISKRSAGAYPQISEILRFCDFFLVSYTVFFIGQAPRWPVDQLSRLMAHATCFQPFGGCDKIGIHLGVISSKNSLKRGMNRQFRAKRAKYKNCNILRSI